MVKIFTIFLKLSACVYITNMMFFFFSTYVICMYVDDSCTEIFCLSKTAGTDELKNFKMKTS